MRRPNIAVVVGCVFVAAGRTRLEELRERGVLATRAAEDAAARSAFLAALLLQPDSFLEHNNLGAYYERDSRENLPLATFHYRQAALLNPTFTRARINAGSCLRRLGQRDEARAEFTRAVAQEPSNAAAHNGLALSILDRFHYLSVKKGVDDKAIWVALLEALVANRRTVGLDPTHSDALYNTGYIYLEMNFRALNGPEEWMANAHRLFHRVLHLYPNHVPATYAIARSLYNNNAGGGEQEEGQEQGHVSGAVDRLCSDGAEPAAHCFFRRAQQLAFAQTLESPQWAQYLCSLNILAAQHGYGQEDCHRFADGKGSLVTDWLADSNVVIVEDFADPDPTRAKEGANERQPVPVHDQVQIKILHTNRNPTKSSSRASSSEGVDGGIGGGGGVRHHTRVGVHGERYGTPTLLTLPKYQQQGLTGPGPGPGGFLLAPIGRQQNMHTRIRHAYQHVWYHERRVYIARFRHVAVAGKAGVLHSYADHDGRSRVYIPSQGPLVPLWLYERKPWQQHQPGPLFVARVASVVQMSSSTYYHWVAECVTRLALLLPLLDADRRSQQRHRSTKKREDDEGGREKEPLVLLVPSYFSVWRLVSETLDLIIGEQHWVEYTYMGRQQDKEQKREEASAASSSSSSSGSENDTGGVGRRSDTGDGGGNRENEALAVAAAARRAASHAQLLVLRYDGARVVTAAELLFADWAASDSRPGQEFLPPRLGLRMVRAMLHSTVLGESQSQSQMPTPTQPQVQVQSTLVSQILASANGAGDGNGRASMPSSSLTPPLLVYISRTKTTAARRSVHNEPAVLRAIQRAWTAATGGDDGGRGSVVVFDGKDVTLRQQVALFARASVVFGTHGSALANIAFCLPGTAVIEVALPSPNLRMFMHAAAALGLPYWLLPAAPAAQAAGGGFEGEVVVLPEDAAAMVSRAAAGARAP
eukprot:g2400.t1